MRPACRLGAAPTASRYERVARDARVYESDIQNKLQERATSDEAPRLSFESDSRIKLCFRAYSLCQQVQSQQSDYQ